MSTAGWNALETGQSRKYSAKKSLTAQFQELNAPKGRNFVFTFNSSVCKLKLYLRQMLF